MIAAVIAATAMVWALTVSWFRARGQVRRPQLPEAQNVRRHEMECSGELRRFYIMSDATHGGASGPRPVIVGLHGGRSSAAHFARVSHLPKAVTAAGLVLVLPEAADVAWTDARDLDAPDLRRDVTFIERMLSVLDKDPTIDARHVGVVGHSSGGTLAMRLAIEIPDRIAAAASINASLPDGYPELAPDGPGRPLLLANGSEDRLVPIHGGDMPRLGGLTKGGRWLSRDETVAFWKARNGCNRAPTRHFLRVGTRQTEITDYPETRPGAELCVVTFTGANHGWPEQDVTADTNIETLVVQFLVRHLGSDVEPEEAILLPTLRKGDARS